MRPSKSVVVFTSFFAAKVFAEAVLREKISFEFKIYVMGEKTSSFLGSKGFKPVLIKAQKAQEFALSLEKELARDVEIFLPGPPIRAFDMKGFFEKIGKKSHLLNCYETLMSLTDSEGCRLGLERKKSLIEHNDLIFSFFSPSAVKSFLLEFKGFEKDIRGKHKALVLGDTTYAFCKDSFFSCVKAKEATAESIVDKFLLLGRPPRGVVL